ncbi:uncharacterized protein [Miscanthus floridulus]|uniref:uncharacterized protein n=1 Tax=Miscanthus floridulus TaxID=154761 RepID=UPI00345AF763
MSKVSSTGASKVDSIDYGGNTWIHMSEDGHCSARTAAGNNVKRLNDVIKLHIRELFGNHGDQEKVIVPLGGTLIGAAMAWFVMPVVLRKMHKYASDGPFRTLWGDSTKKHLPYETSLWSAQEDPAKYIITFMAFSQMAAVIEPGISAYLPQAWKGAFSVSVSCKAAAVGTTGRRRLKMGCWLGVVNDGISEAEVESSAGLLLSSAVKSPLHGCGGQLTGCGKGPDAELAYRAARVACMTAMAACMAVMPRAITATSAAKDSNVRGAPEDADDNPDAADGAGADGRGWT